MIIEKTIETENGVTFNQLTHSEDFFACGYTPDLVVMLITPDLRPMGANSKIKSQLDGFGATSYEELIQEAENLNLILPDGF